MNIFGGYLEKTLIGIEPLPLPQLLEGYERIVPGSAERILKMAEEQQTHRQRLERQALQIEPRNSFAGIYALF